MVQKWRNDTVARRIHKVTIILCKTEGIIFHSRIRKKERKKERKKRGKEGRKEEKDFPGGAVVKNLPANAGDMGLSPDPGRSHMLRSN